MPLTRNTKRENSVISKSQSIKNLIDNASSLLTHAPDTAFLYADKALKLARLCDNKLYIVQSLLISGDIKNIKGETQQAYKLYKEALHTAQINNYFPQVSNANLEIGKLFYNWGQYDTSFNYFNKVLKYTDNSNANEHTSVALTYIGKYYMVNGHFDKALNYLHQALKISRAAGDFNQTAYILNTEGKYYIGEGNVIAAFQCYQEAYAISEKIKDNLMAAEVCNYLGGLYLQTYQYEKSLEFHKKALILRNFMDNTEGMAKSYNNIGKAYLELNKTDSAFIYFNKSADYSRLTGYKKGLVKALANLGKVYLLKKDKIKSEQLLVQSFELAKQAGYKLGIAESCQALGDLYKDNLLTDKAISNYKLSLQSIEQLNYDELLRDNYKGLYECFLNLNDYKTALKYHELLLATEKKLLNVENNRQLALLQITYNNERKEKDNQVLRKENDLNEMTIKRKSTFLWLIAALLLSSILFCLYLYNRFYSKTKANKGLEILNQKIVSQNLALEKLNKELNDANDEKDKLLSIISHELRNPLYWFQNLAEVLSKKYSIMTPENVQKTLAALDESSKNAYHLMDNLLHWSRSKLNRISPKKTRIELRQSIIETISMYETIMQYKNISLELDINPDAFISADVDLFSCVIRNLVSNAIKYTPVNGKINITNEEFEKFHKIIVSDNGIGIPAILVDKLFNVSEYVSHPGLMEERGSGFGLKLCKEFVELHGGTICVENRQDEGSRFFFTIPK